MKTPKLEASSRPVVDPLDLSDEAREWLVRSDGMRKRAIRFYTNSGKPVPPALYYRVVPEFNRLRAAARRRSSSGAGISSRAMVRRAPPPPKEEEEAERYDPAAFGRSLSALDFVPDNPVETVVATIYERSAEENEDLEAQRRHLEEVNEALLQKGLQASLEDPIAVPSDDE